MLVACCPNCNHKSISIYSDLSKMKKGLSLNLNFVNTMATCRWGKSFYASELKEINLEKRA